MSGCGGGRESARRQRAGGHSLTVTHSLTHCHSLTHRSFIQSQSSFSNCARTNEATKDRNLQIPCSKIIRACRVCQLEVHGLCMAALDYAVESRHGHCCQTQHLRGRMPAATTGRRARPGACFQFGSCGDQTRWPFWQYNSAPQAPGGLVRRYCRCQTRLDVSHNQPYSNGVAYNSFIQFLLL